MNALILGASGLVGGNCLKHFKQQGWNTLGTHLSFSTPETVYFNTLNLSDEANADLANFKPSAIVHCGALTWVDYCETHPEESFEKTVVSVQNTVKLAKQFSAKLVYLGTDYVFDGTKGFYREDDTPRPLSVYGRHKLEAEQFIQCELPDHLICRITNVYGDEIRGKNFIARLVDDMRKGQPLNLPLPHDQYATPTNAADVARAIFSLLEAKKSGIYHLAGTDCLNRVQLAERVARYFGHSGVSITPVATHTLNQPALRPLLGGFSAAKFNAEFPHFCWRNADDYLSALKTQLQTTK